MRCLAIPSGRRAQVLGGKERRTKTGGHGGGDNVNIATQDQGAHVEPFKIMRDLS
jgi:hypothetical protein